MIGEERLGSITDAISYLSTNFDSIFSNSENLINSTIPVAQTILNSYEEII